MDGGTHLAPMFVGAGDRWARSTPVSAGRARVLGLGVAVVLHVIVGVRLVAIPGQRPAADTPVEIVLAEVVDRARPAEAGPELAPPDSDLATPPADVAAPTEPPRVLSPPALAVAGRPPAARPAPTRPSAAPASASLAPVQTPGATQAALPAVTAELISAYHRTLLAHLERYRQYPQGARLRREQGVAMVRFTVDRGGRLLALAMDNGSGYPALDEEAIATLRRAEPLPALPAEIAAGQLEFVLPLRFQVK